MNFAEIAVTVWLGIPFIIYLGTLFVQVDWSK